MGEKEPDEVSIKVKGQWKQYNEKMNKIRRSVEKAMLWVGRTLRTIFVVVWDILLAIAILVLLIVAVLTTAVEKFFALLSSLSVALLGKIGAHLLGTK